MKKKNEKEEQKVEKLCLMAQNSEVNIENFSNFIFDKL